MKKCKNCDGSGIAIDLDTSTECPYCDGKGSFDLDVNIEAKGFRKLLIARSEILSNVEEALK